MIRILTLVAIVASGTLAGCLQDLPADAADLAVRPTTSDSIAAFTVESVKGDLRYADLVVIANSRPYKLGPSMDHADARFEALGKDQPSSPVAFGDVIRIPLTGKIDVELRHAPTGRTFQAFALDVEDHTPPPKVALGAPHQAAKGVDRQTHFSWSAADDASGVTYQLEWWPKIGADGNTPSQATTGLAGTTHTVPESDKLLPAQTYAWHVRALDGMGNIGPWSQTWEFTTGI